VGFDPGSSAGVELDPAGASGGNILRDLRDGWQEFRSRTWLVLANIHAALLNVSTLAPLYVIGPAVAKRYLGGATAWALISSAFGAGLVVGGFVALAFRPQRPMLTGLGMSVVNVAALALLAVHAPAIAVAPAAVAAGANLSFLNTVWETTLQHEIPPRLLSRVVAYDWLAALVFQPLSYAVVGVVAAHGLGLSGTLWVGSAVAVASTTVVVSLPSIRELRRPTEPTGAPAGADPPDRAAPVGAGPRPS
jgi:hypothetical protein